jgi:hypothetical protein
VRLRGAALSRSACKISRTDNETHVILGNAADQQHPGIATTPIQPNESRDWKDAALRS